MERAGLREFSLLTQSGARSALDEFFGALSALDQSLGGLGAAQARLEAAAKLIRANAENYSGAASRITDADIAQEAAELARLRILQQAGAAILAQANTAPELTLALLG